MNKQEYILELINKGYSDEEIELLVKDKFPEEEIIPFMPAPLPSNYEIIRASEYSTIAHLTGDKIAFTGYIGNILSSGVYTQLSGVLIIEIKTTIGSDSWTPNTIYIVKGENNGLGKTINLPNSPTLHLLAGHFYQFENGKDPIDLGTTLPVAPGSQLTPQEAFDQTWDAVKKVNENIGYTNLVGKTGADLFTPLTIGKGYIVPLNPSLNGAEKFSGLVTAKGSTDCWLVGIGIDGRGNAYNLMVKVHNDGTITAGKTQGQSQADYNGFVPTVVGTPMNDKDATTKKYVDDKVPNGLKGSTITFEDGTTLVL